MKQTKASENKQVQQPVKQTSFLNYTQAKTAKEASDNRRAK